MRCATGDQSTLLDAIAWPAGRSIWVDGFAAAVGIRIINFGFSKRTHGRWANRLIHESVSMNEVLEWEQSRVICCTTRCVTPVNHRQMIEERLRAAGRAAKMMRDGKRTSSWRSAVAGPAAFVRSFLLKGGWRDGRAGSRSPTLPAPCFAEALNPVRSSKIRVEATQTEIGKTRLRRGSSGSVWFREDGCLTPCGRTAERGGAISLTPRFSPVISKCELTGNRFLTVLSGGETRETV